MARAPIDFNAARYGGLVNEIDQGRKTTYTTPNSGIPTRTTRLNPTLEKAQTQQDTTFGNAVKRTAPILSNPTLDFKKIAPMTVRPGMTGQNAIMSRLSPQIQRERNALHTQLVNWGLQPGTQAYNEALARQGETENDLLSRAAIGGIGLDTEAHRQGVSDQQAAIQTPLNALTTMGGQTSANMAHGSGQIPNDLLAALKAQYGQQNDQQNNSRQSTSDWLNFALNGARAIPDVVDTGKDFYNWIRDFIP